MQKIYSAFVLTFFNGLEKCVFELTNKAAEVEIVIGASHSFIANYLIPTIRKNSK